MHDEEHLLEQVKANLPAPLTLEYAATNNSTDSYDGFLSIGMPDNTFFNFIYEVKAQLRKETLLKWHDRVMHQPPKVPALLICKRITSEMGKYCLEHQLNVIDSGGNMRLSAPGLFMYISGRKTEDRINTRSRISEGVLKLLFILLSDPDSLQKTYRQLASYAGISLGMVSKAFDYLEQQRYYRISKTGRRLTSIENLLVLWIREYAITLRPKLKTLRLECPTAWQSIPLEMGEYWGGEAAANKLTKGYLQPEVLQLFTPLPLAKRRSSLGFSPRQEGKLKLTSTFWGDDFLLPERAIVLLTIAELIATQDDRNIETAGVLNDQYLQLKTSDLFGN